MALLGMPKQLIITSIPQTGRWIHNRVVVSSKGVGFLQPNSRITTMCSSSTTIENYQQQQKVVWIWTENKQVMTTAVERGWNTFIFTSHNRKLATEWSSIALIDPLFLGDGEILDSEHKRVATFSEISSPEQLQQLQPDDDQAKNVGSLSFFSSTPQF